MPLKQRNQNSVQISYNSFKNKITDKLISYILYIYLNVCKQMIDAKLWLLCSNTWKHIAVCKQMINNKIELFVLNSNIWNNLTVHERKMSSGSFKNLINKMCSQIIYLMYIDLAFNNL